MTHEFECAEWHPSGDGFDLCICDRLRAAYRRGYTAGYNDHARSVQHWQDTHGAYRQHGEGENP